MKPNKNRMVSENILHIIQNNNLLSPSEIIVVAVSGGTDSLALLHLLYRLKDTLKIDIHIATFNHGLREQAAGDVQFVQQIATQWALPVTVGRGDVPTIANEQNIGVEAAARIARYDFLAEVAHAIGAKKIAVAHHANDQAETVLMHVLRGSGLQGLQGMALESRVPNHPELALIRPLLTTWRADLEDYCKKHNLHPREDETNRDTAFLRNYTRFEMLPYLKKRHPGVESALIRLAEIARVDQNYIEEQYQSTAQPYVKHQDGYVTVDRQAFQKMHPAMQRHTLYHAVYGLSNHTDISHERILHAVEIGKEGSVGAVSELPGGWQVRVDYDVLVVEKSNRVRPVPQGFLQMPVNLVVNVDVPSVTEIPQHDWKLEATSNPKINIVPDATIPISPASKMVLRTRRPGDRIALKGMGGKTQKIKDLMINRKIPQHIRGTIPLLVVDDSIVAVLLKNQWLLAESDNMHNDHKRFINFFVYFS